jgi:hypothetical protein
MWACCRERAVVRHASGPSIFCADVCVQRGETALLTACAHGHLAVVQWLVSSAGSDAVNEFDDVRTMLRVGLREMLMPPHVVVVCRMAILRYCWRVQTDTWKWRSVWCRRRSRVQRQRGTMSV